MEPRKLQYPVRVPRIGENEQLTQADFQRIASMPFAALRNALSAVFDLDSGKIEGLDMYLKDGSVWVSRGFGVITVYDPADADKKTIEGTYIITVDEDTELFLMPLFTKTTMYVYLKFNWFPDPASSEDRNFLKSDGTYETKKHDTLYTYSFTGGYDLLQPTDKFDYPSKLLLGTIDFDFEGSSTLSQDDRVMTLFKHKESNPIDHPLRSISADHINENVVGDFVEGSDLNLGSISEILQALRGVFTNANDRIRSVIDENGNVVIEAVKDVVDDLVQQHLAGITDGQGGFSKRALINANDENGRAMAYQIGVRGGVVDGDGGQLYPPEGFSSNQTVHHVSINRLIFPCIAGTSVELVCNVNNQGTVDCHAISNGVKRHGTANFISIGIKRIGS